MVYVQVANIQVIGVIEGGGMTKRRDEEITAEIFLNLVKTVKTIVLRIQ